MDLSVRKVQDDYSLMKNKQNSDHCLKRRLSLIFSAHILYTNKIYIIICFMTYHVPFELTYLLLYALNLRFAMLGLITAADRVLVMKTEFLCYTSVTRQKCRNAHSD